MLFPPAASVAVAVNGRPVLAYHAAYLCDGRVYAPLSPFITRFADRAWYDGDTLVIERDGRTARIRMEPRIPKALDDVYVPLAPVLRSLGLSVKYHPGRVEVRTAPPVVVTPAPFDATKPSAPPSAVFTPIPVPTPRPVWTGSPLPRRTPLPVAAPTP